MKPILVKLALISFGILLPLIVLELGLRLLFPRVAILRYDSRFGFLPRANLNVLKTYGEFERVVAVKTNSLGLRATQLAPDQPAGVGRIVTVGDSFTFGDDVGMKQSWPAQLQSILDAKGDSQKYQVINEGVSGFSTTQEIMVYNWLRPRLHPAAVVLGFCVDNDNLDNLCVRAGSYEPRHDVPCARFQNDKLVVIPPLHPSAETESAHASRAFEFAALEFRRATIWNPRFLRLLGHAGIHPKSRYRESVTESWYDPKYFAPGWALSRHLIEYFRAELSRENIPLIVLIIPSSVQVNSGDREYRRLLAAGDPTEAAFISDPDKPQRMFSAFCAEQHLACVDPLPALREASAHGIQTYTRVDRHWMPAADRIAAAEVANTFERMNANGRSVANSK